MHIACKYIHLLPNNRVISEVLAACWVHDVIEDCRETYNDVKNVLGERVADIAYALTNEKGKTRKERANDKYYEGIRNTPFALIIMALMFIFIPINFLITGNWGYSISKINPILLNWFRSLRLQ